MDYVLSYINKGEILYWKGKGKFTKHLEFAAKYPSWQMANSICNRIKRWKLKFSSVDEELESIQLRLDEQKKLLLTEDWYNLAKDSKLLSHPPQP